MKLLTRLTLMTSALVLLASCGLRGDLNRPTEPMFGNGKPVTETPGDIMTDAATGEDTMAEEEEEQDDYSDELLGGPGGSL